MSSRISFGSGVSTLALVSLSLGLLRCGSDSTGHAGGSGGGGGADSGPGAGGGGGGNPEGPFPPVADFAKDGSFQSQTNTSSGPNGSYSVYLPTPLGRDGVKHPIVGWMSGGGTTPAIYPLLPRLATQGFVVIASNTTPGIGAEVALGQEILAGIDWAIAENARQGSELFGHIETTKIASMGYSMGSLATFTIANDARITTTVHISGGNMVPERIQNLHAPAAFLCGITSPAGCTDLLATDCDIAAGNCDADFQNADTPVFYGKFPYGHVGIISQPHADRIGSVAAAWLRYRLMDDTTLAGMFVGPSCTLCSDPNWTVQQKNL